MKTVRKTKHYTLQTSTLKEQLAAAEVEVKRLQEANTRMNAQIITLEQQCVSWRTDYNKLGQEHKALRNRLDLARILAEHLL